jgi:predicted kinase
MFFLQMSGVPGSGKSTLARAIAKKTGAIIIDHDIVKSAFLESAAATDITPQVAGVISYDIEWALVDFHLSQGHSVILDSPCLYEVMVEKGTALAGKHHAGYKYVECALNDIQAIDHRLKTRERLISQNNYVPSEEAFRKAFEGSKRPSNVRCLKVDSSQPLESYLDEVIAYIQE